MLYTKKLTQVIGTASVLAIFALSPLAAFAQSVTPGKKAANQEARLTTVKTRADAEISKRLTSLNELTTKLQTMKKLSAADLAKYTSQIQADITGLTALKTKIDADTDVTTLRADAKSIFTSYRIFAVFDPQVKLLAAADRMTASADKLSALADKLQTRIQTAGNPANLTSLLTDMRAKVSDAKSQYAAVEAAVTSLTPASYPATSVLTTARAAIKTGAADLKAALSDAKQIRQALPKESSKTATPTQ